MVAPTFVRLANVRSNRAALSECVHCNERSHDGRDHGSDSRRGVMTLVDTNVLLDVATNDRDWAEWSVNRLDAAATVAHC